MTFVRLLKSWTKESGKKLPMGKITRAGRREAQYLIREQIAEEYKGPFGPGIEKMKTNLFKPKE